jgi:hypothetical protein
MSHPTPAAGEVDAGPIEAISAVAVASPPYGGSWVRHRRCRDWCDDELLAVTGCGDSPRDPVDLLQATPGLTASNAAVGLSHDVVHHDLGWADTHRPRGVNL